jgi:hypothetical protein
LAISPSALRQRTDRYATGDTFSILSIGRQVGLTPVLRSFAFLVLALAAPALDAGPLYSTERIPLHGGSELVTIFEDVPPENTRVPLLCVLRDTLGDDNPQNDRLRYVWLLNNVSPGWWQRAAAAMPFFYSRAASRQSDHGAPTPILDLADKHPRALSDLGQASLQFLMFDPAGLALRASTRAYLGNRDNEQKANFAQALAVISAMENEPESGRVFSSAELARLRARFLLGQRRFGGLVTEERFPQVSANALRQAEEARGRNWEILRQAAESNGLWFDPLTLGSREPEYALIWIRRGDLSARGKRPFDGQLLRIGDPWMDSRLRNWKGYSQLDADGEERIPLALYDLEDARAPLLLVDFRDPLHPKRHELFERGVTDLMKSVFDLSYVHDWYYFATRGGHNWVAGRHGGAQDPLSRLRAYSKLKMKLGVEDSLDPALHAELQKQLAHLEMNPLESDGKAEARMAPQHYARLMESAKTVAARVDRDRAAELGPALHSRGARILFRVSTVATAGLYRHREQIDERTMALLDVERRAQFHEQFLRQAAAASRIEVEFDTEQIRESLAFLANRKITHRAELLASLFSKTEDESLRLTCLEMLREERDPAAARELVKLARLEGQSEGWRRLCMLYAQERMSPAKTMGAWSGAGFSLLAH